jgi:hypothetical protein
VYAMSEQVPSVQVFPGVQEPELSIQFVSSLSYCVSEQVPASKQVDLASHWPSEQVPADQFPFGSIQSASRV